MAGVEPGTPRYLVAQRRYFPRGPRATMGRFASDTELYAVRGDGPLKHLRDGEGREELYDLDADPSELHNLVEVRREEATKLRRLLESRLAALDPGRSVSEPEVDAETLRRLEELGYVQ